MFIFLFEPIELDQEPKEFLELLKTSKIDLSFDGNILIRKAERGLYQAMYNYCKINVEEGRKDSNFLYIRKYIIEIFRFLLKDERVTSKLTDEEINKYNKIITK
jgi:hypothetical protein